MTEQTVVITGAATGLGREAALYLSSKGTHVIGGGFGFPDTTAPFESYYMDVRNEKSVRSFVEWAIKREGRIDVLINCAAIQLAGALEITSIEEVQQIIDTNLIGTMRVCREIIPIMRKQKYGRIINVSSLGGRIAFPFHTAYCASKFAVEGMSECLQYELRPYGIHVSVLAPGSFFTQLAQKSEYTKNAANDTVYTESMHRVIEANKEDCSKMKDFSLFSLKIEEILNARKPKLRYYAGRKDQGVANVLRRFLPDNTLAGIIRKNWKL